MERYLPHVVGDGHPHRLKITKAEGMTILLTPDVNQLRLFTPFLNWGSVVEEVDVATHRLDDLDIDEFDLLKIDVQGAELMVFQHGRERLRNAVAVQTETSFVRFTRISRRSVMWIASYGRKASCRTRCPH